MSQSTVALNKGKSSTYRPLLPLLSAQSSSELPEDSRTAAELSATKKRGTGSGRAPFSAVAAACEFCRKRKTKCTGERPRCLACAKRNIDCQYVTSLDKETRGQALKRKHDELEGQNESLQQLFSLIKTSSMSEGLEIFKRIRSGVDVQSILTHFETGNILMQMALQPAMQPQYELPYLNSIPASFTNHGNPYLQSGLHKILFNEAAPSGPSGFEKLGPWNLPFGAAKLVEPRLMNIVPSDWTTVKCEDQTMRNLIEAYLIYEYPTITAFQKDYFLDDMLTGCKRFCSSLLVNAILASACHGYQSIPQRSRFWDPQTLRYQFLAEAKRLWDLEVDRYRLTTIQAGIVLDFTIGCDGMDKLSLAYLLQSIYMSNELGLFNLTTRQPGQSKRMYRAMIFTGWCIYSWQVARSYYFSRKPWVESPPLGVLPNPTSDSAWYGELWLLYPQESTPWALGLGHCLKATAELRSILNDISLNSFGKHKEDHEPTEHIPRLVQRLEEWYENLPGLIDSKRVVLPTQIKIHIEYFTAICTTLKSLSRKQGSATTESTKSKIFGARSCVETLMRLYYLRHGFETYDGYLVLFLTWLGGEAIQDLYQLDALAVERLEHGAIFRSTIILCINGLNKQAENVYLATAVSKVLQSSLAAEERDLVRAYCHPNEAEVEAALLMEQVRSSWPLSVVRTAGQSGTSTLEDLVKEYEELSIEVQSPSVESYTES